MRFRDFLPPFLAGVASGLGRESSVLRRLRREIQEAKLLAARMLVHQLRQGPRLDRIRDGEFKVFSQFGDDGIIQYLLQHVPVAQPAFVEFGVEDYQEANTRFLLLHDNWRGLVLDGNAEHMQAVRGDDLYWRHDLTAVAAFVDRDNINALLAGHGFTGELGLLSIDIDGNDYWVWEQIEVVQPALVIVEYNSVFGARRAVSIPYDPRFVRSAAHYSNLYWGCSLKALCFLAERKGYAFVGCNSAGNNAYFLRRERLGVLQPLTAEAGYVESRFRESRAPDGRLTFLGGAARRAVIGELPVVDVETGEELRVAEL